jgi:hypothetical protein
VQCVFKSVATKKDYEIGRGLAGHCYGSRESHVVIPKVMFSCQVTCATVTLNYYVNNLTWNSEHITHGGGFESELIRHRHLENT